MKRTWYLILLAVGGGATHGRAIRDRVAELSDGEVQLWPTSLYGALRELLAAGYLQEAAPDTEEDARRRGYELTPTGREAVHEGTRRIEALAARAREITDAV